MIEPALESAPRPSAAGLDSVSKLYGSFAALRFTITRITDYAMRAATSEPRVVKDWRRFQARFDKLQALGSDGLRRLLGV